MIRDGSKTRPRGPRHCPWASRDVKPAGNLGVTTDARKADQAAGDTRPAPKTRSTRAIRVAPRTHAAASDRLDAGVGPAAESATVAPHKMTAAKILLFGELLNVVEPSLIDAGDCRGSSWFVLGIRGVGARPDRG